MKRGGTGGAKTNANGLAFEAKTSLQVSLEEAGFRIDKCNNVYSGNLLVAKLVGKAALAKWLKESYNIDMKEILSAQLRPDEAIYVHATKTLHIVEKKYQSREGSVDEKPQSFAFKLYQYQRLVKAAGIKVKYAYLFNDWWEKPKYKDSIEWILSQGGNVFFEILPLNYLGLPKPTKNNELALA